MLWNTVVNCSTSVLASATVAAPVVQVMNTNIRNYYWRASVASETLTGVTQSKIGDVYLFIYWRASVASETVLGVDNAKSGICYIYMYVCMYGWYVCSLNAREESFSPKNTAI